MNYAVLLSGGSGSRAGTDTPKQYIRVNGRMMVTVALKALALSEHIDGIVIVAAPEWHDEIMKDVKEAGLPESKIRGFAVPGETRQLSILSGLNYIEGIIQEGDSADTVLIHDAARPFVSEELLDACYGALPGYDGVMPVLPMKDTVYLSDDGRAISALLDRSRVYAGQAPELFDFKLYYEAVKKLLPDEIFKINGASEPAVMAGMKIAMIPGDERNIKVTTPRDVKKYTEEQG